MGQEGKGGSNIATETQAQVTSEIVNKQNES